MCDFFSVMMGEDAVRDLSWRSAWPEMLENEGDVDERVSRPTRAFAMSLAIFCPPSLRRVLSKPPDGESSCLKGSEGPQILTPKSNS